MEFDEEEELQNDEASISDEDDDQFGHLRMSVSVKPSLKLTPA